MKISILLLILISSIYGTNAQNLRLDVQGDAKIRGKIDVITEDGGSSVAVGRNALQNITSGDGNTAIGFNALRDNTTGENNTAVGLSALLQHEDGESNTALGFFALSNNVSGDNNTAVGFGTLSFGGEGFDNTAIGKDALLFNRNSRNTAVGEEAGKANTTGFDNTFIGHEAGLSNTTGQRNTFLGEQAGRENTTGDFNTFVGENTGYRNDTGEGNVFVGRFAGFQNITGGSNTFMGVEAGLNNKGSNNVFLGHSAGRSNSGGGSNVFVGLSTGVSNTSGSRNVFLGQGAGNAIETGSDNTFVGFASGQSPAAGANGITTVGAYTGLTDDEDISNAFTIGTHSLIAKSHSGTIGNISTQEIGGYVNWGTASDGRMKKNVKEDVKGLDFINALKPVSYQYNALKLDKHLRVGMEKITAATTAKMSEEDLQQMQESQKNYEKYLAEKSKIRYTGFIAQDVEEAAKGSNFEFSGLVKPSHDKDHYSLRYAEFVVPLVKAVQEQQTVIEEKEERIVYLEQDNQELRQAIVEVENRLNRIETLLFKNQDLEDVVPKISTQTTILTTAKLYLNQPNPFTQNTTIRYFIPEAVQQAELRITNSNGEVLKTIPIETRGTGQNILASQALSAGAYFYSLILDGNILETKQMVLTK